MATAQGSPSSSESESEYSEASDKPPPIADTSRKAETRLKTRAEKEKEERQRVRQQWRERQVAQAGSSRSASASVLDKTTPETFAQRFEDLTGIEHKRSSIQTTTPDPVDPVLQALSRMEELKSRLDAATAESNRYKQERNTALAKENAALKAADIAQ